MASSLAAITTGGGGLVSTADSTGNLDLKSGTTTIVALTSTGAAVTGTLTASFGIPSPSSVLIGGKFTVAMAASACTIAIKTDAGNDPSAGEPVKLYVRSATATDGAISLISITAATSVVIPSTALMGTTSAVASRIYVGALNNAGTIELYAIMTLSGTSLYLPPEQALLTTTIMNTASDSAQIPYSTTARSAVGHRVIGYFESTQATAGTWATSATVVQQMGDGVKRTGDTAQVIYSSTSAYASAATTTPYDNTIPQNTEGNQVMTISITPTSALNLLNIISLDNTSGDTTNSTRVHALFQDSTADALAATNQFPGASNYYMVPTYLYFSMASGTVSLTTFKLRIGGATGTIGFNGSANLGTGLFNGTVNSFMQITEVFI